MNQIVDGRLKRVVLLSILLLFFTIPHTLEDFATGEPGRAGVPVALLAFVVSLIFALQALGLFWLGQGQRRGVWLHLGLGTFWPLASGFAQVPVIMSESPYRAGFISIFYVGGIIVIGVLLFVAAALALRSD